MTRDRVALVTGGSGGIGSEICRHLAAAGFKVVVNYNSNLEKAQSTLSSLEGDGHQICQASNTEKEQLSDMAGFVEKEYGRLDVLVNNSGVTKPVPHEDMDALDDDWIDKIMQVNFRGAFACIRAFKDLLQKGSNAIVVNISSIAGQTGIGSNVAYCASKAAVDSMTRSLGRALAPDIRVVSLSPGWVMGEYASTFSPEYIQEQKDKTPLARIANPEDVAKAVVTISESFTFSTGCIFPVDGGRPLL
ncbi:MAG: SDR family NAD(P)-dependent oxidoreductase [Reichenbachiella sp.]|uniref:SDR family NAD(P)-dependent oxidoreductase n=1 Tax=Reichenbachiella sp. TaxID=2184521 RepID=UPI003264DF4D